MTVQGPLARMEEFVPIYLQTILVNVQTGGQEKIVKLTQTTVQAPLARMEEFAMINLQTILVDVDGWSGKNCEIDTDDCASSPCKNGGICTDQFADYSCGCPDGWSGKNCEIDTDDCASSPCKNG